MGWELLTTLGVGLLLGLRHALDPDHFIAVSTIASRTGNVWKATVSGMYWGMGHTLTLLMVGIPLFIMKSALPEPVQLSMEVAVGLMLVLLGWTSLQAFKQKDNQRDSEIKGNEQPEQNKFRLRSFLVGMIHGLAGSGAMAVMVMTSMKGLTEALLYLLVFGAGTIAGMSLFAILIGFPFMYASRHFARVERGMGMTAGAVSILFGCYYLQDTLLL